MNTMTDMTDMDIEIIAKNHGRHCEAVNQSPLISLGFVSHQNRMKQQPAAVRGGRAPARQ